MKEIIENLKKLHERSKIIEPTNFFLVFNKQEWLMNPIIKWTEEEIDNADEKGFIGTKGDVDCYLARKLNSLSTGISKNH